MEFWKLAIIKNFLLHFDKEVMLYVKNLSLFRSGGD